MSEKLDQVAEALKQSFKDAVAASAGAPFGQTGVVIANDALWQRYARAAVETMREPTDEMAYAVGSNYGPGLEEDYRAMIDAALK